MGRPRVHVISLGGTISSTGDGPGVAPSLSGEDLLSGLPQLSAFADVSATSVRQVPGSEVTVEDAVGVARKARREIDADATGVVVTQGTDTIEETAFVLDLLVDREAPIAVTGAMRNPTLPGADGPANLLAAAQVAADPAARGLGAVVVFNDEIHAARFVRKAHTQSPSAFSSFPAGPIGCVAEDEVRVLLHPAGRRSLDPDSLTGDERVAILTAAQGDDGSLVPAVRESGYSGLVVEALGGGHVPSPWVGPLVALSREIPIVLASRTGGGDVLRRTYDFPGSEMDLAERGLIPAGQLDARKARLLLTFLLRSGVGRDGIEGVFGAPFA